MKAIYTLLQFTLMTLLLSNCKSNNDKVVIGNIPSPYALTYPFDSTKYLLDTTMRDIKLNNASYSVFIYRNRFDDKNMS